MKSDTQEQSVLGCLEARRWSGGVDKVSVMIPRVPGGIKMKLQRFGFLSKIN